MSLVPTNHTCNCAIVEAMNTEVKNGIAFIMDGFYSKLCAMKFSWILMKWN